MLKRLSIFTLLFVTLIGFSSCNSDDDDMAYTSIVGSWVCVSSQDLEDGEIDENYDIGFCYFFNEDGTGYEYTPESYPYEEYRRNFKYTYNGKILHVIFPDSHHTNPDQKPGADENGYYMETYKISWNNKDSFTSVYEWYDDPDWLETRVFERQ